MPGRPFPISDFDLAFKQIRHLFKPPRLYPIVHLEWQVLVPVFTSLIVWLEANTFIKVHGFHSLTKYLRKVHLVGRQQT